MSDAVTDALLDLFTKVPNAHYDAFGSESLKKSQLVADKWLTGYLD